MIENFTGFFVKKIVPSQKELHFCLILFLKFKRKKNCFKILKIFLSTANNQGSERISTTTETRTSAVTSGTSVPATAVSSTTITTSKRDTNQKETKEFAQSEQQHPAANSVTNEQKSKQQQQEETDTESAFDSMHLMLEPHLRPVSPDRNSKLSTEIFNEHKQLANEYLKVITALQCILKYRIIFPECKFSNAIYEFTDSNGNCVCHKAS